MKREARLGVTYGDAASGGTLAQEPDDDDETQTQQREGEE